MKIAIMSAIVVPDPPILIKASKNGLFTIYGAASPAEIAATFASIAGRLIVCINGSIIFAPCTPKVHKNVGINAKSSAATHVSLSP